MAQYKTPLDRKLSIYGFDIIADSHNMYAVLEIDITDLRTFLRKKRVDGKSGSLFASF